MKLYLGQVQPEWKRSEEMAQVRVWPLSPQLFLEGGQSVQAKFCDAFETERQREREKERDELKPSWLK